MQSVLRIGGYTIATTFLGIFGLTVSEGFITEGGDDERLRVDESQLVIDTDHDGWPDNIEGGADSDLDAIPN